MLFYFLRYLDMYKFSAYQEVWVCSLKDLNIHLLILGMWFKIVKCTSRRLDMWSKRVKYVHQNLQCCA